MHVQQYTKELLKCIKDLGVAVTVMTFIVMVLLYTDEGLDSNASNLRKSPPSTPSAFLPKWADNVYNFNFTSPLIWNTESKCRGLNEDSRDKTIVIIINSGRENQNRRQLIRETWGSIKYHAGWSIVDIKFLLGQGRAGEKPSTLENLLSETIEHNDIILGDFLDTYRNLTFKTIMGYEWLRETCSLVRVVIKCDDDVVFNIFELINFLNQNPDFVASSDYYGDAKITGPIRKPKNHKWFVDFEGWPKNRYPVYCSGFGVLTTMIVIQKVLTELQNVEHKISLDDVFLSGIVPDSYNSKLSEDEKDEMIRRLKIPKGIWKYDANPKGSTERLRKWYTNTDPAETKDLDENYPIFSIITHDESAFQKDFKGTWTKIIKHYLDLS